MKQTKQEQGFTLIELIMVIVIMGILSAVVVPKFFNLEERTHDKVEESVIGNIQAGLMLYSVDNMASTGKKAFPTVGLAVMDSVLDEIPENWSYNIGSTVGSFQYAGRVPTVYWSYSTSGGSSGNKKYTIGTKTTTDPSN